MIYTRRFCKMISEKYFFGFPCNCYCRNPELIENYDLAIADETKTWICHHRLEKDYTEDELRAKGMYFNRPAEELIFVENEKVHRNLPHKGSLNRVKKRSKKVICVETGVVYTSIAEAARVNNLFENHIGRCCNGKQGTTGGYHWEFLPQS